MYSHRSKLRAHSTLDTHEHEAQASYDVNPIFIKKNLRYIASLPSATNLKSNATSGVWKYIAIQNILQYINIFNIILTTFIFIFITIFKRGENILQYILAIY